jgi:hypothetical protein
MADVVDRIRRELDARIEQLRPLVGEFERLERAAAALARAGVRAMPGVGPRPPARVAAEPERAPAGRSMRAKPAAGTPLAQRRRTASDGTPASSGAKPRSRPAARSPRAGPAAVAAASEIPTNTVAATISRLVKQGRVRRLEAGGYAPVETPAGAAQSAAAAAAPDAAAVADDTAGSATPTATGSATPTATGSEISR